MIGKLAVRTLAAHPVRTAVLAAGFGTGVAVMAILLGVAQVVLEQARSPLLAGGGHVVVTGIGGGVKVARMLVTSTLQVPPMLGRARVVSPSVFGDMFLVREGTTVPVKTRAGVPSLERLLGDPEAVDSPAWVDTPGDEAWTLPKAGDVLRAIDRFHAVPSAPDWADSWAEWLYFNGRAEAARFYLTFLTGPPGPNGRRVSGVRLQIDRNGKMESFSGGAELDEAAIAMAPDLTIAGSRVRLSGLRYDIHLDLKGQGGRRVIGDLFIDSDRGRTLPPIEIRGARGWRSGYVVPAMSGRLGGSLSVDGERVSLEGGAGYHDHNWGFWKGVSWQWGQVHDGDMSIVYGRVFPPREAADPDRVPGFLGVMGPDGPLGYATRVAIEETDDPAGDRPRQVTVHARSNTIDLTLSFSVDGVEASPLKGPMSNDLTFLQMRGNYSVKGTVGARKLQFESAGSAETFRSR